MENISKLIIDCLESHKTNDCYLSEITLNEKEIEQCEKEILADNNFINQYSKYGMDIIGEYIESFISFNEKFYYDNDCKWYMIKQ